MSYCVSLGSLWKYTLRGIMFSPRDSNPLGLQNINCHSDDRERRSPFVIGYLLKSVYLDLFLVSHGISILHVFVFFVYWKRLYSVHRFQYLPF